MKRLWIALVVVALLIFGLLWTGSSPQGEIASDLLFGWIVFLGRVLPQIHWRGDGLAIFAVGSLVLLALGHSLLSWFVRERRRLGASEPTTWKFRYTAALFSLLIAIFVAGVAMTGATHQIIWLARDDQPWFGPDVPKYFQRGLSGNNLKQQALAVHNTIDTYNAFPSNWKTEDPKHSWVVDILPFLPYEDVTDHQLPWDHPKNIKYFRAILPPLLNPQLRTPPLRDKNGLGLNHYAGNTHLFDRTDRFSFKSFPQGATGNTLMIGEVNAHFVPWGQPENSRDPQSGIGVPAGFGGPTGSPGAKFALLDGSVRTIHKNIDPKVLKAMSQPQITPIR